MLPSEMHEELFIRNFGPLKDIRLSEIRPVMVFVGTTGSGKSLLLKVLTMVRHIAKKSIIREALKSSGIKRSPFRLRLDTYLQFSNFEALLRPDSEIRYRLEWGNGQGCMVSITQKKGLVVDEPKRRKAVGPFLKLAFIGDLRNLVASWTQKSSLAQQARTLDNHFAETLALWEEARDNLKPEGAELGFLKATITREKKNGDRPKVYLNSPDGRRTPLERSASGQKSSVSLALIVSYLMKSYDFSAAIKRSYLEMLLAGLMEQEGGADLPTRQPIQRFPSYFLGIMVEEPELSLDPETQIRLADEVMRCFDYQRRELSVPLTTSILFTTHSPYWIVALNTILQERSCASLIWSRLGGYLITSEGTLQDLRDEEAQLLATPNMDATTLLLDERYNRALMKEARQ